MTTSIRIVGSRNRPGPFHERERPVQSGSIQPGQKEHQNAPEAQEGTGGIFATASASEKAQPPKRQQKALDRMGNQVEAAMADALALPAPAPVPLPIPGKIPVGIILTTVGAAGLATVLGAQGSAPVTVSGFGGGFTTLAPTFRPGGPRVILAR